MARYKKREGIQNPMSTNPRRRGLLLSHAVNELLAGDIDAGKAMLRVVIESGITFLVLAEKLDTESKSLRCMFAPKGILRLNALSKILKTLQEWENIKICVKSRPPERL